MSNKSCLLYLILKLNSLLMTRPSKKGCKFPFNKILIKGLDVVGLYYVWKAYRPRLKKVLSYETNYLAFSAYNIYCYFIYNVFLSYYVSF